MDADFQTFMDSINLEQHHDQALELGCIQLVQQDVQGTKYADNKNQSFVNSSTIVSFTDTIKGVKKEDVMNSVLFAQLAADKKFSDHTEDRKWYAYFVKVLSKLGYILQDFEFTKYDAKGESINVETAAIEILMGIATENELALIKGALDVLKGLASDSNKSVQLFQSSTQSGHNAKFNIMSCTTDSNGDALISFGAFYLSSTEMTTNVLFTTLHSSCTSMYKSTQKVVLNDEVYSMAKEVVLKKLGKEIATSIQEIEI